MISKYYIILYHGVIKIVFVILKLTPITKISYIILENHFHQLSQFVCLYNFILIKLILWIVNFKFKL